MENAFGIDYLGDVLLQLHKLKSLADDALAQISEKEILTSLGEKDNSVAVIMKHMSGNMRSRWTDFLTSDGEKVDRNRDSEFEIEALETGTSILQRWESGWHCVFGALESLTPDDLGRTVLIRGEPHSVTKAINRQLTHYAYHVGQLVFMARHFRSGDWRWLSVPRGKSEDFNAEMRKKHQA
jgi:hypothetical protein